MSKTINRQTVLVIEDDDLFRLLLIDLLETTGFITISAENGEIGVQRALKHRPDVILCDVSMPRLNGFGVWEALQAEPIAAQIPFIFMTGCQIETLEHRGIYDYLKKPFSADALLSAIAQRLEKPTDPRLPVWQAIAPPPKTLVAGRRK